MIYQASEAQDLSRIDRTLAVFNRFDYNPTATETLGHVTREPSPGEDIVSCGVRTTLENDILCVLPPPLLAHVLMCSCLLCF